MNILFSIFAAPYIVTATGSLCSDNGDIAVYNEGECKTAAEMLNNKFGRTIDNAELPKGCFMSSMNRIHFNQHSTGSSKNDARQICFEAGDG